MKCEPFLALHPGVKDILMTLGAVEALVDFRTLHTGVGQKAKPKPVEPKPTKDRAWRKNASNSKKKKEHAAAKAKQLQ